MGGVYTGVDRKRQESSEFILENALSIKDGEKLEIKLSWRKKVYYTSTKKLTKNKSKFLEI